MTTPDQHSVQLFALTFGWPDGTEVLRDLYAVFGAGRTGLIGANGTGKSTLLRLIAGELMPTSGSITTSGAVGYLPQQLTLRTEATAADLLGVRGRLDALRAIESGDVDSRHFDVIGDDWDIEARTRAVLDGIGLHTVELDRPVGRLSGGETILAALAGLRLAGTPVVLLDEPTNNLDREARHRLYRTILDWRGTLIVVSHDHTLLDLMDETAELRDTELTVFGGTYSDYREHLAGEQEAAEQALRTAQQRLAVEKRQRVEAETKLARRNRYARTDFANKRRPKVIMQLRKREAQVSAGKLRDDLDQRVDAANQAVRRQSERVRSDPRIRIELPDPGVPAGRRLAELRDSGQRTFLLRGPRRMALTGPNGIGKTRLLRTLLDPDPVPELDAYAVPYTDRIGYLPQRLDQVDDDATVLDTVRDAAPDRPVGEIRANLARFLFDARDVQRLVGALSGGERFRVALARLLLASPPNQLLVLDEPTNNLDLHSTDELVDALAAYRGGLLVVSHDDAFLARLGIDSWITLSEQGLALGEPPTSL